jgi:hypothetical protein
MDKNGKLNPNLTVNDLKQVLEHADFRLTCASLKRFSQLEKDVLCTTNTQFKENCPKYCSEAATVPRFVIQESDSDTTTGQAAPYIMRNLRGSFMLQPAERLKTISYSDVADEDECKARCIDNTGATCKLATFNSRTKECTIDSPTVMALEKYADIANVPFITSTNDMADCVSFEKLRN